MFMFSKVLCSVTANWRYLLLTPVLLFTVLTSASAQSEHTDSTSEQFSELVEAIATASLNERSRLIEQLSRFSHPRTGDVLKALQEGNFYVDRATPPAIGILQSDGRFIDPRTEDYLAAEATKALKKIPINNRMRGQLRTMVAQINLNHQQPAIRESAVLQMVADGVDEHAQMQLQARQAIEGNNKVRAAITLALALYNLKHGDDRVRADAIDILGGSLQPEARSALLTAVKEDPDKTVRTRARQALADIDSRIQLFRLSENIFFGLSLGSVLLLSAIGLAITFGVMGVINMAHGELMMIGAYTTWVIQQAFPNHLGYSLLMAVPAAFLVAGTVGVIIERGVIRFLYGRPLETLLATFGISLILQQAARSIFSPLNRAVSLPEWMSGSLVINPVFSVTYNRLYILLFGLLVFFALLVILKKTSLGLKVRAVSQNRAMARAVGVRANWVDAATFGLGSGIAGVAGVALSQLTNVGPNLGQAYIIDSFMVVVFGGVGNLWGTLVGAMGLGIINKFLEPYAGAVLAKVLVLVLLILFIQKRPKGIFPQKGRAAAD